MYPLRSAKGGRDERPPGRLRGIQVQRHERRPLPGQRPVLRGRLQPRELRGRDPVLRTATAARYSHPRPRPAQRDGQCDAAAVRDHRSGALRQQVNNLT